MNLFGQVLFIHTQKVWRMNFRIVERIGTQFLTVGDEDDRVQKAIQKLQEELKPQIQELQKEVAESQLDKQKFDLLAAGKDIELKGLRGEMKTMEEQQQLDKQEDRFKAEIANEAIKRAKEDAKKSDQAVQVVSNVNTEMQNFNSAVKELAQAIRAEIDQHDEKISTVLTDVKRMVSDSRIDSVIAHVDILRDKDGNMTGADVEKLVEQKRRDLHIDIIRDSDGNMDGADIRILN